MMDWLKDVAAATFVFGLAYLYLVLAGAVGCPRPFRPAHDSGVTVRHPRAVLRALPGGSDDEEETRC